MDIKSKVLTVGVALLLFVSVVGVGAVVSGYVIVGDPGKAVSQVLSGNVTAPGVGVESVGVGKVNVPSVRVSDASIKEVTFEIEFFVNNTHNALGGKLDSVEYAVYMSGSRDGDYSFVGNGSMGQVTVPPGERTTEVGGFEAEYSDIVSAVGSSAVESEGSLYARVEGEASIRLGPFGFSVPFEETRRVIQND